MARRSEVVMLGGWRDGGRGKGVVWKVGCVGGGGEVREMPNG